MFFFIVDCYPYEINSILLTRKLREVISLKIWLVGFWILFFFSFSGIFSIFGRLSAVCIGLNARTCSQKTRFAIFHVATVFSAVSIIFFSVMPTFPGLCALSGGLGYFLGLRYALKPALLMEIFSPKRFSTSWSYGMALLGVGSLVFPPLGGAIK